MSELLPPQIKTIWRVSAWLTGVGLLLIGLALLAANLWLHWPQWLSLVVFGIALLQTLVRLILVVYRYRFWRYTITPTAVFLERGFIWRKNEAIPIARVQNVTLEAGPLLQWQHLQAVNVETASTTHTIDGLTPPVAQNLRDQILTLAQEAQDEHA